MAINQDLLKLQTKIGNSFLRAFYPIDYRSNQNILKNVDELLQRETKGLRSLASTTSSVNQKIAGVLTGIRDDMTRMRESMEDMQNAVISGDDIVKNSVNSAQSTSNSLFDLLSSGALGYMTSRRGSAPDTKGGSKAPSVPPTAQNKPKADTPEAKPKGKYSIPKGLTIIGLAVGLWNMWEELEALDPNMKKGEYRQAVAQIIGRAVASFGLMWVGAFVGASVGAPFFGVGAIPGFILGLLGGAVADYAFGDSVDAIVNQVIDYMYTGDEEEEAQAPTPQEISAAEAAVEMREPPVPAPPLEPVQQQVSEEVRAQIPLAPPIMGPEPPAPPLEQTVDSPVEYPGPVEPVDLRPFAAAAVPTAAAKSAASEAANRAENLIETVSGVEAQNKLMEQTYGPNAPAPPQINQASDTQATFNTSSDQAGSISPQENVAGVKLNFALAGKERSGMPDPDILGLVQRAAAEVGMTSITITSGKGDYISEAGRKKGQKSTVHSTGKAVDVAGFADKEQKVAFARAARALGAGGIGVYKSDILHVDLGAVRHWNWGDPSFPKLGEGAKVSKPTLALIGEAGEPEYVVPQSKAIKFAHEMIAARPQTRTKRRTHVVVVPILT